MHYPSRMPDAAATVERNGRSAVVKLHGDLAVNTSRAVYGQLRGLCRQRGVREITLDFTEAGRLDSSGVAVITLLERQLQRAGKHLAIEGLGASHEAAMALRPAPHQPLEPVEVASPFERLGDKVLTIAAGAVELAGLISETLRQGVAVLLRRKKLPKGAFVTQLALMGSDGVFIVGLLSFLLGMTMALMGALVLKQFGAGAFVADMVGLSMVRELGPLITAIIVTGRTGAAIAAELGTMKVRSEVDAIATMGINPVRFLVLPRLLAITVVGPALTLLAMALGVFGGMVVSALGHALPMDAFWGRLLERVELWDFLHGLGKSVLFAWIIGLSGCHLGLRAGGDASAVGAATTRTVVASIFFIIIVDAIAATISTIMRFS